MKKTQVIEIRRSIKKTILTFLAIAIIVSLGVAVYLGIHFAAQGLEDTNSRQYHKELFQDFQAQSVYGFTEKDVQAVNNLDQVEIAAGEYSISVNTTVKGKKGEGTVIAFSEGVNQGELRQGKMPEQKNECALEERWAKQNGITIGDTINVQAKSKSRQEELTASDFQVTGLVSCVGSSKKSAKIITPQETFSEEAFSGVYSSIVIRIQGSEKLAIYGDRYQQLVADNRDVLQKFLDERTELRYQEIRTEAETELTEKETALEKAGQKLADAEKKLEEKEKKLQDSEKQYEDGKKKLKKSQTQIADGEKQLQEGAAKLQQGEAELSDAETELNNGRNLLLEARASLDTGWQQLADAKYQVDEEKNAIQASTAQNMALHVDSPPEESETVTTTVMTDFESYLTNTETVVEYDAVEYVLDQHQITDSAARDEVHSYATEVNLGASLESWKSALTKISEAETLLMQQETTYAQKLAEYDEGLAKYNEGLATYNEGLAKYEEESQKLELARQQYKEGQQKLEEGGQRITKGKEALSNGKKEYEDNKEKYKKNEKKIEDAKVKLSKITPVSCILFGRNEQPSYITIGINADNLKKLGLSFAVSFMCVAVMACYSAIGRMVEEQRKLVGVQKAQGFFASEIFIRYMYYGLSSTLLGIVTGVAAAYYLIQPVLLKAYLPIGNFSKMDTAFLPGLTALIAALVLILAAGSVWLASRKLLKEQAFLLLKDPVPKGRGNILSRFQIWKKIPLFTKVVLGNLFSEKKRVFTCITGIAGCTVLVVMGAILKLSSDAVPQMQYQQIYQYDKQVTIKKNGDYEALEKKLSDLGCESTAVIAKSIMFEVEEGLNFSVAVMSDQENFDKFVKLKDAYSKEPMEIPKEGILMSQGTAEFYHIKAGDSITTVSERGEKRDLLVEGIFENYVGQRLVFHPAYYEQVYGQEAPVNQYYVKLNGVTQSKFQDAMNELSDVTKVADVDEDRADFDNVSDTLNQILIILVILSIAMAFMILTNLISMNIRQKERELAIMRVNGFTLRETKAYMMREAVFITLLGILLGIVLGQLLGEQSRIMMQNRGMLLLGGVKPLAWAAGAAISGTFSLLIHLSAMRAIKKIKLTNIS